MAKFAADAFTGTQYTELSAYNAAWSKQTGYTGNVVLGTGGTWSISNSNTLPGAYQHSGTPASADYEVAADIRKEAGGNTTPNHIGVCARMAAAAETFYFALYSHTDGNVRLFKRVAGTQTQLGSSYTYTNAGTAARLLLRVEGSSISVKLNAATIIGPVTDTAISTAGKAGIYQFNNRETGIADSGSLDAFSADDIAAGDVTPPTLTSPTGTGGSLVCSGSVTTDEGNGTLYAVATASATSPSAAQVKAGQDHTGAAALRAVSQAVSATGAQTVASGAVTAGTRYLHYMHEDAATNQSTVSSSASFTVTAGSATLTSSAIKNNTGTLQLSAAAEAYVSNPTTGALVLKKTGLTSHATTGVITFSDAALAAATSYRVVWVLTATGAEGLETLTAT